MADGYCGLRPDGDLRLLRAKSGLHVRFGGAGEEAVDELQPRRTGCDRRIARAGFAQRCAIALQESDVGGDIADPFLGPAECQRLFEMGNGIGIAVDESESLAAMKRELALLWKAE